MSQEMKELTKVLAQQSQLLMSMASGEKAVTGTMTANKLHGIDGLWSTTTERDVVTAHITPTGIGKVLPRVSSMDENPRYGILTGYTGASGSQPTNACGDAPAAYVKGCTLTTRFGTIRFDTNEIEINKAIRRLHRGDFTDLILHGEVFGDANLKPENLNKDQILNVLTKSEMVTAGVSAERELTSQMWQGTFGVGNQFAGLDSLINTGYVDVDTNVACPAVDSDVKDFAYDNVEGGGRSIVEYMTMMEYFIYYNASKMGLLPATWVIAMRPELWQVLTEVWPCQYNTNKCASSMIGTGSRTVIDGRENIADRDSMRRNLTIDINGRVYPVVVDDGIFESDSTNDANLAAGQYASSIYFVPLTIVGGLRATWREYLPYNSSIFDANVGFLNNRQDFWSDDGFYLWAIEQQKYCYKLSLKTEQRVVLRTPHLAGKIQNVMYAPLQHLRSSDPSSEYWVDGGLSLRDTNDTINAPWA
jgi:hypothetical protein